MTEVLVCLDGHHKSHLLLEAAKKIASSSTLAIRVLYVESPKQIVGQAARKETAMRLLTAIESDGATVVHVENADIKKATCDYISACLQAGDAISHIVVGQYAGENTSILNRRSTSEELIRRFGQAAQVSVIPLEGARPKSTIWKYLNTGAVMRESLTMSFIAVTLALLITQGIQELLPDILGRINTPNIYLVFLFSCVVVSLRYGLLAALVASMLSFFVINYFYTIPLYRFNIGLTTDFINITIFLSVAVVISVMSSSVRANMETARQREKRSRALYDIARLTADAENQHQILEIVDREVHQFLDMDAAFLLRNDKDLDVTDNEFSTEHVIGAFDIYPDEQAIGDKDIEAMFRSWTESTSAGFGTVLGIGSSWRFEVMATQNHKYGILGVKVPFNRRLDTGFGQFISSLADQVAITLERARFLEEMSESRFREEREKLRSMLLSSVSHDLKTPLASVIGSISVLRSLRASRRLTTEQETTLTETALEEAQRLDSFITNILSMTRIDSGDVEFSIRPHDPIKPLNKVLKTLRARLKGREINIDNQCVGVAVDMDALMTAQVLQNVIDNAAKYSPADKSIDITLEAEAGSFIYKIRDHGRGIPDDKLTRIFDKYERLTMSDSQVAGTGLGLAITQSVMQAQGGSVRAENHPEGGAVFILSFAVSHEKDEGE